MVRGWGLGALNLYAHQAQAFGAIDTETGAMFAAQAAVVLANAETFAASVKLAEELRVALDSRAVIDQAMGILMGRHGYSQELAFGDLRSLSQARNIKVRSIATEIVGAVAAGSAVPNGAG